jgi:amphi-Trp domain-containing protein
MSDKDKRDKDDRDKDDRGKDKRDRQELEFATTTRVIQVAEYLNRIADGLRAGALTLEASGQAVHLEPADTLRLEIEAESKPDKGSASLQLELSWKHTHQVREPEDERLVIETGPRDPLVAAHAPKKDA